MRNSQSQQDVPWKLNTKFFFKRRRKRKRNLHIVTLEKIKKNLFPPEVEITSNAEDF